MGEEINLNGGESIVCYASQPLNKFKKMNAGTEGLLIRFDFSLALHNSLTTEEQSYSSIKAYTLSVGIP